MHAESPCNGICSLGPHGFCVGCGRTGEEIAGWINMAPEARDVVCHRAEERLFGPSK